MPTRNLHWLTHKPFAHRGLHDHSQRIPENSITSFQKAITAGYGIELDVQVISGQEVIVFHDDNLSRMCNREIQVSALPPKDLHLYHLLKTSEKIPRLEEVLKLVSGRVPLLIEIKRQQRVKNANQLIANSLFGYKGPYAIMSFDPFILGWFYKHAPLIPRGQLTSDFKGYPMPRLFKFLLRNLLLNFISKPDFIAFDKDARKSPKLLQLKRKGVPVIAWTVKDVEALGSLQNYADNIIFEGFQPNE